MPMRISTGFETRVRNLRETWSAISSMPEEPTNSLEQFENALAGAQVLLEKRPPAFKMAHCQIETALNIIQTEKFLILDKKNLERLKQCSSYLLKLHAQAEELRTKILRKTTTTSFTAEVSGTRYKVDASEMEDSVRNAAHNLAAKKLVSHGNFKRIVGMLQRVTARAQQVRQRYLVRKAVLVKEYLESGVHRTELREFIQDVIAELRSRQMQKTDIASLVSHFGSGSSRWKIDTFVRALIGDHEYRVYTTVPGLSMESAKAVLPCLQFLQRGACARQKDKLTGLPMAAQQNFRTLTEDTVVAESTVRASNPAEATTRAHILLHSVIDCVTYLERSHSDNLRRAPPTRVYEGQRLVRASGIGAAKRPDDSLTLRSSKNPELRDLLETVGATLPASSRTELQERVLTSMHWYMLGANSPTLEERYVNHVIALEILLSGKLTERDKKRVIAERAAQLCRIIKVKKEKHIRLIKRLYNYRSNLVHTGLYPVRSLRQDLRDLERKLAKCLFAVIDGIENGCHTLTELEDKIDQERVRVRRKRIRNSKLTANKSSPFQGNLLLTSGKKIADLKGRLKLIDEGARGYAYHELDVSRATYAKAPQTTSADEFWIKGESAGHQVELRHGRLTDGRHFFLLDASRTKCFAYRAFDNVVFF